MGTTEPYCLALVLCEYAHQDSATGKWTLVNTFSVSSSEEFPFETQFYVYGVFTEVTGQTRFTWRIVDAKADIIQLEEEPFEYTYPELVGDVPGPLHEVEFAVQMRPSFPRPGVYHCELWINGQLAIARRLLVVQPGEIQRARSQQL
jgi:hypothetical protein